MVPTASTNSQQQYAAAPAQAYPGVDNTATGSVVRAGHPVPRGDVSGGQYAAAPVQSYPAAPAQAYPSQSHPSAPSQSAVQSSSLPPVASAPAPVMASAPAQAAPAARPLDRPAQVAATPAAGATITVQAGDTVYGLARRHGVSASDIFKANGLTANSSLALGQRIVIPGAGAANVAAAAPTKAANQPAEKAPAPANREERLATLPKTKAEPVLAAAPQPAAGGDGGYTVASGDSLYSIARKLGTTTEALKQANGLSDGYLKIGQKLKVPAATGSSAAQVAAAKPVKTDAVVTGTVATPAPEIAAYTPPKAAETAVKAALEETGSAPSATGIGKMRWPVRGKVVSGYGDASGGKANDGIDISVPEGTPIKAAENGVVIYAGDGLKEFGNTVLVRHEDGTVTVYGHASKLNVTRGEKVRRGQDIALSGMSGNADRPKLHFEVRKNSAPVNPSSFLE